MRADQSALRLAAVRRRLLDLELDGLVVTGPENLRYLSGFSGSLGYLVIGSVAAEILGDSRYWLQMETEAPGFTLVRSGPSHGLWALVAERLRALGLRRPDPVDDLVEQFRRADPVHFGGRVHLDRGEALQREQQQTTIAVNLAH